MALDNVALTARRSLAGIVLVAAGTLAGCDSSSPVSGDGPPSVTITSPADGAVFEQGVPIQFSGTGSDPEDGTLSGAALGWTSSIDGPLGQGGSLVRDDLSTGLHQIRLTGVDRDNNVRHAFVSIQVEPPNSPPSVTLSSPVDGSVHPLGGEITFSGSGADPEDGSLSGSALTWSGDRMGALGTGRSFTRSDLPGGMHTVTLTARDSRGAETSRSVGFRVNVPPSPSIATPGDGSVFAAGATVSFSGSASDPEDGTLAGSSLVWASTLDGTLGTGDSFSRSDLSPGTHGVTLTATDEDGAVATDQVTVTIEALNQPPVVSISSPADGASFAQGQTVTFAGTASDAEDGVLSGSALVWTSSLDGEIGTGVGFSRSDLSTGSHVVTLRAQDGDGASSTAQVSVSVFAGNQPPSVTIDTPRLGDVFQRFAAITFSGSATDPEDGTLTGGSLVWFSSLDGQIGTGSSFQRTSLSAGEHQVRLRATDSEGVASTTAVKFRVNSPPSVSISSPTNGRVVVEGDAVLFSGSGSDAEDGTLSGGDLVWTSSRDGTIGFGTSFTRNDLSVGVHTITLRAFDDDGGTRSTSVSLTVENKVSFASDILPIFRNSGFRVAGGRCTDCHFSGGGTGVDFTASTNAVHTELTSAAENAGSFGRVIANNTTFGDLLCKITNGSISGSSCTITSDDMRLFTSAVDRIKKWISQGARNN